VLGAVSVRNIRFRNPPHTPSWGRFLAVEAVDSVDDLVLDYHLVAARTIVDLFGIADPKVFGAKLRKTG
jgi:hypothetical protein